MGLSARGGGGEEEEVVVVVVEEEEEEEEESGFAVVAVDHSKPYSFTQRTEIWFQICKIHTQRMPLLSVHLGLLQHFAWGQRGPHQLHKMAFKCAARMLRPLHFPPLY